MLSFLVERESRQQGCAVVADTLPPWPAGRRRVIADFLDEPFLPKKSLGLRAKHADRRSMWQRNSDMVECVSVLPPYEILARFANLEEACEASKAPLETLRAALPSYLSCSSSSPMGNVGNLLYIDTSTSSMYGWKYVWKEPGKDLLSYDNYFQTGRSIKDLNNAPLLEMAKAAVARMRVEEESWAGSGISGASSDAQAIAAGSPDFSTVPMSALERCLVPALPPAARLLSSTQLPHRGGFSSSTAVGAAAAAGNNSNGSSNNSSSSSSSNGGGGKDTTVPDPQHRMIECLSSFGDPPEILARFRDAKSAAQVTGVKTTNIHTACYTAFQRGKRCHVIAASPHYGWSFVVIPSQGHLEEFDNYFVSGRAQRDLDSVGASTAVRSVATTSTKKMTLQERTNQMMEVLKERAQGHGQGQAQGPGSPVAAAAATAAVVQGLPIGLPIVPVLLAPPPGFMDSRPGQRPPHPSGVQIYYRGEPDPPLAPGSRKRVFNAATDPTCSHKKKVFDLPPPPPRAQKAPAQAALPPPPPPPVLPQNDPGELHEGIRVLSSRPPAGNLGGLGMDVDMDDNSLFFSSPGAWTGRSDANSAGAWR